MASKIEIHTGTPYGGQDTGRIGKMAIFFRQLFSAISETVRDRNIVAIEGWHEGKDSWLYRCILQLALHGKPADSSSK